MKLAVVGSRKYLFQNQVVSFVKSLPKDVEIISGGAAGVDSYAVEAAKEAGMPHYEFTPQRSAYGPVVALFERNKELAWEADVMVAFHDGESHGTMHAVEYMTQIGKKAFVVRKGDSLPTYEEICKFLY